MKFYKDRFGKWYTESKFRNLLSIFSPLICSCDEFITEDFLVRAGCITKVRSLSKPSVVDLLSMDLKVDAVFLYRDIHKTTITVAKRMVDKIQDDMWNIKHGKEPYGQCFN